MVILPVDPEYLDFYGLTLLQGRQLSNDFSDGNDGSFILTESAVRQLGLNSPVIDARLSSNDEEFPVVGVVADFNPLPATYREFPIALQMSSDGYFRVAAKLPPGDFNEGVLALEESWRQLFPDEPFNYMFLEDKISDVYGESARLGTMGAIFTCLAILVASLGILGLASYAVEQRTKEIGIRKVLGSSTLGVLKLFMNETIVLVMIANVVAAPVTWYMGHLWLEEFVQRIGIGPWTLVGAGAVVLSIAIVTVISQAHRVARANPVKTLRYE